MKSIVLYPGGSRFVILPALILAMVWVVPTTPASAQDECEIPLFVQQYVADANVMILADNSASMNEVILHPDYDRHTTFEGPFVSDWLYLVNRTGLYSPQDAYPELEDEPHAVLVESDNGEDGRYWGNYLNWIFYYASDAQRAGLPQVTRIQVLKLILNDIVGRAERIRFGIEVFHLEGPGNIIGRCGKSPTALRSIINGITANKWTPLGESMETLVDYFSDTGNDAPIQSWCQKNFIIAMTDGYPTMDIDVSPYLWDADGDGNDPSSCSQMGVPFDDLYECSDHMDDVAWYLFNTDLRDDMPDVQNVVTYTIGFTVDYSLLHETAENGNGHFYYADNAIELVQAFQYAMQDIVSRISSGSAVAVVSTERGDDDRMYRGKFMPGSWEGFLECFALPYEQGEDPVWEAGQILADRSPSSREIFTAVGQTVHGFHPGNASNLMRAMNVAYEDTAAMIISWARGNFVPGFRNRADWKLGDIVSSTPVIVGPPSNFSIDPDYQAFHAYHANRPKMVYVGANDGMLHCFDGETGSEMWAFVPEFALPKLPAMADSFYCHTFACDQTVTVSDLKLGGIWRTVLATGGRQGGASYFAMDITEPASPSLLWQTTLADGHAYASEVEFAVINDIPVALIGSGLNETDGLAYMYAYELQSGALLGVIKLSQDETGRNKATRPKAVDRNLDGQTDLVYIADMLGNLWRFAIGDSPAPGTWARSQLFTCGQPITATPTPAFGEGGKVLLYFGTGTYLDQNDVLNEDQQSFYCVYDRHDGNMWERRDLVDQTSRINDVGTGGGWYVDLWHEPGERVTEQALVLAEVVYFTAYSPLADLCGAGGHSWFYQMSYDDGSHIEDEDGNQLSRDVDLGDGIASRPVADIVNEVAVVQSSDATINLLDIAPGIFHLNVISWQEDYDFVQEPPEPNP